MVVLHSPRQEWSSAAALATEQPSLGTALLSPMGEGSRKGDLKKACLISSCQHTAADWTSTTRSKHKNKNHKEKRTHQKPKHFVRWSLEREDPHGHQVKQQT